MQFWRGNSTVHTFDPPHSDEPESGPEEVTEATDNLPEQIIADYILETVEGEEKARSAEKESTNADITIPLPVELLTERVSETDVRTAMAMRKNGDQPLFIGFSHDEDGGTNAILQRV